MTPSPRPGFPAAALVDVLDPGHPGGHVLTQVLAQTGVVNWLDARFAGSQAQATARW